MRGHSFVAAPGARPFPPWRLALLILLALAAVAVPLHAQSVLGTIRGTVTDAQGGMVPKAAVLITDEATGVPRALETNAEGFYEASNLRPGTYRVEIVTTSFKKFEKPGVVVSTGGGAARGREARARRDHRDGLGLGRGDQQHRRGEPVRLRGSRLAAAARPAAQQPRHAVLPAAEPERPGRRRRHAVPGRPDLRRLLRPGRPGLHERDLRHGRQLRPRPRRDRGGAGALELLQRRVRRPRRRRGHHQARRQPLQRDDVLRLQLRRPQRPHLRPEGDAAPSATTRTPTPTSTAGARASVDLSSPTRPSSSRTTRARTRRRSTAARGSTSRPRRCAPATSRARRSRSRTP